jgi:chromosome segregation ATPase
LIKETQAILDAEKKKLEEKQGKTQQEMEALVDVNITYNILDDGKESWKDIPILFADDRQRYTKTASNSVTTNENEILELKLQIQILKQDKNTIKSQAKQIQQEKASLELQIKEKDKELVSLRSDNQSLQRGNSAVQQQITRNDSKINSLQSENQELKLKINSLKYQLKEKENENCIHRTSSLAQTQKIETLNHENQPWRKIKHRPVSR